MAQDYKSLGLSYSHAERQLCELLAYILAPTALNKPRT